MGPDPMKDFKGNLGVAAHRLWGYMHALKTSEHCPKMVDPLASVTSHRKSETKVETRVSLNHIKTC